MSCWFYILLNCVHRSGVGYVSVVMATTFTD
jgi:hypothetical protein